MEIFELEFRTAKLQYSKIEIRDARVIEYS